MELSFNPLVLMWFLIAVFRPACTVLDLVIETAGEGCWRSVGATFWFCTDIVTLGSDDFMDFALCFLLNLVSLI